MNFDLIGDIKCVIFDFDATLYTFYGWNDEEIFKYYKHCVKCLINNGLFNSIDEACETLDKKYPEINNPEHKCVYCLMENGLDTKILKNYLSENIYDITKEHLNEIKVVDTKKLYELAKKYRLFLLSDSPEKYLSHLAKQLKIDLNVFEKRFSNNWEVYDISKAVCMKQIIGNAGVNTKEILMVGDSEVSDIVPAKKLGLQAFKVDTVDDTNKIIEYLINNKI